jgi:hypothetical protein
MNPQSARKKLQTRCKLVYHQPMFFARALSSLTLCAALRHDDGRSICGRDQNRTKLRVLTECPVLCFAGNFRGLLITPSNLSPRRVGRFVSHLRMRPPLPRLTRRIWCGRLPPPHRWSARYGRRLSHDSGGHCGGLYAWTCNRQVVADPSARTFLFTLVNNLKVKPQKLLVKDPSRTVILPPEYQLAFSGQCDRQPGRRTAPRETAVVCRWSRDFAIDEEHSARPLTDRLSLFSPVVSTAGGIEWLHQRAKS